MLVVLPRRSKKPKSGDATAEELQAIHQHTGPILPLEPPTMQQLETANLTDDQKGFSAYQKLRIERANQRLVGTRAKRAAEAAAEEKDKAK